MKLIFQLMQYPWIAWNTAESPTMVRLRGRLHEVFWAYSPRRLGEGPKDISHHEHEIEVPPDDPQVEGLVRQFCKEVAETGAGGGVLRARLSTAEIKAARFLQISCVGDEVDAEESPNRWPTVCEACGFPDLTRVPEPFYVSETVAKKQAQEVFATDPGLLIVRPRVLALLSEAIGKISSLARRGWRVIRGDPCQRANGSGG